ncbi:hypothetical protein BDV95DRAFT_147692 [Massariosphaeria phaeospora]|uniref:Uncharacterized protein n=1 Tax=Massariosphaeria phaeospora TaxID=100035 RepID=A0A7C8MH73_9PLEO|nr:hypothetical protein BDV95DRAFT_147692 [Massariosphaeria phaeospora]
MAYVFRTRYDTSTYPQRRQRQCVLLQPRINLDSILHASRSDKYEMSPRPVTLRYHRLRELASLGRSTIALENSMYRPRGHGLRGSQAGERVPYAYQIQDVSQVTQGLIDEMAPCILYDHVPRLCGEDFESAVLTYDNQDLRDDHSRKKSRYSMEQRRRFHGISIAELTPVTEARNYHTPVLEAFDDSASINKILVYEWTAEMTLTMQAAPDRGR